MYIQKTRLAHLLSLYKGNVALQCTMGHAVCAFLFPVFTVAARDELTELVYQEFLILSPMHAHAMAHAQQQGCGGLMG